MYKRQVNSTANESIILTAGFHAITGSFFVAKIEEVDCSPNSDTSSNRQSSKSPNELAFYQEKLASEMEYLAIIPTKKEMPLFPPRELSLKIQPNPIRYEGQLEFYLPEPQQVTIQLIDQMGRVLQTVLPAQTKAEGAHKIDIHNENNLSGLFYIVVKTPRQQQVEKVVMSAY